MLNRSQTEAAFAFINNRVFRCGRAFRPHRKTRLARGARNRRSEKLIDNWKRCLRTCAAGAPSARIADSLRTMKPSASYRRSWMKPSGVAS
jgi:hypothetical protein